jgi:hypothetical protein
MNSATTLLPSHRENTMNSATTLLPSHRENTVRLRR